jgi:hypothetical protein
MLNTGAMRTGLSALLDEAVTCASQGRPKRQFSVTFFMLLIDQSTRWVDWYPQFPLNPWRLRVTNAASGHGALPVLS